MSNKTCPAWTGKTRCCEGALYRLVDAPIRRFCHEHARELADRFDLPIEPAPFTEDMTAEKIWT